VDWNQYGEDAEAAISAAGSLAELEDARVRYLGRRSELAQALRGVRDRETGMTLNSLRERLEARISAGPGACEDCLVPKPVLLAMLHQALGVPEKAIDLRYPGEA